MGPHIRYFRIRDKRRQREHQRQLDEKNKVIDTFKSQIDALAIDNKAKLAISQNLAGLAEPQAEEQVEEQDHDTDFLWLNSFLDSDLFGVSRTVSPIISTLILLNPLR